MSSYATRIYLPPKLFSVADFRSNGIYWLLVLLLHRAIFIAFPELISGLVTSPLQAIAYRN